jgi:hypothetical protein
MTMHRAHHNKRRGVRGRLQKHNNQIMEDMRGKKRGDGGDDNNAARQWR